MSRTILITGASTGIGAATAKRLAPGNMLLLHHNRTPVEPVANAVREQGGEACGLRADLSSESGCRRLMDAVREHTPALDVLVNNAGALLERHSVETVRWELMERIFSLNTFSAMLLTRLAVPLLLRGKSPCIVNITSIAARHGAPTATLYGAAKGALDSFTRGSARELAPRIRVNAVAPGIILTPFHDRYTAPERLEAMLTDTPLGEQGESEHVADAVAFLIENSFITGETVDVNGGLFMR